MFRKLRKAATLLSGGFVGSALRYRVAAAVEHLRAIELTQAATLIDVGANVGQFSLAFRKLRPTSRIIAFEPLPEAAARYRALFVADAAAELHQVAIAETNGVAEFHVTDRSDSSSLLKPAEAQQRAFGVREEKTIQVDVRRMGECVRLGELAHPIMMKIDVQGAELDVVRGCDFLDQIDFIYCELSFVELYHKQALFGDFATYLMSRGFDLAGAFNQIETKDFGPTQADFLFKCRN